MPNINVLKPIEYKILLLLGMKGYKKKEIEFKTNDTGVRYMINGDYDFIEKKDLKYLQNHCDSKKFEIKERAWMIGPDKTWEFAYTIRRKTWL